MSAVDRPSPPPRSARRRPWVEAGFSALDFETTGLDYAQDHVVSFGTVPVLGGRVVLGEAVHQLVAPAGPPSPASVTVHGLRAQDLAGAPPIEEAREVLREGLDGRFVLAWFAQIELAFLARTFGGRIRAWARRTIDVRRLAVAAEGSAREDELSLAGYAAELGVPVVSPHDALDDALVTAQVFLVLAGRFGRRDRRATVGELLRAGRPRG